MQINCIKQILNANQSERLTPESELNSSEITITIGKLHKCIYI